MWPSLAGAAARAASTMAVRVSAAGSVFVTSAPRRSQAPELWPGSVGRPSHNEYVQIEPLTQGTSRANPVRSNDRTEMQSVRAMDETQADGVRGQGRDRRRHAARRLDGRARRPARPVPGHGRRRSAHGRASWRSRPAPSSATCASGWRPRPPPATWPTTATAASRCPTEHAVPLTDETQPGLRDRRLRDRAGRRCTPPTG